MILKVKRDQNGQPARLKARLVARGNLQAVDERAYESRYASVACFDLVRILLSLPTALDWDRQHVDAKGAFLYADIPEEDRIYLKLPNIGGVERASGQIVKLRKYLYGVREAPKLWYRALRNALKTLGFSALSCSECLFLLEKGARRVVLLAYVDGLGLFGESKLIGWVKEGIRKHFKITDLGNLTDFFGVSILEEGNGDVLMNQKSFIEKLLAERNMLESQSRSSSLPLSHVLYEPRVPPTPKEEVEMQRVPYNSVTRLTFAYQYQNQTRPLDCSFDVG